MQARQRQVVAEQALTTAHQQIQQLSSGGSTSSFSSVTGVITRARLVSRSLSRGSHRWTTCQFALKGFACAAHPKMKDVFDLATQTGSDPIATSDVPGAAGAEKLHTMLVMMLNDQAFEIVQISLEGGGGGVAQAAVGVSIRYGAMLQSLLKRRFGEHDETDLARHHQVRAAVERPHQRRHQARRRAWRLGPSGAETGHGSEHEPSPPRAVGCRRLRKRKILVPGTTPENTVVDLGGANETTHHAF